MFSCLKRCFSDNRSICFVSILLTGIILSSCSISYKFTGSSLDYSKTKTITISDFPNNATLVYPQLAPKLNTALKDIFNRRTKLQQVRRNGDMQIEGEITDYRLTPLSIQANALAAQTQLTMTIRFKFTNTKNPKDDIETTLSASQTFDSSKMLTAVQDALADEMVKEITDKIYNQTVARW
jgi:outer membrane lipopolysaccharide assembly protein LptE/RlpB